MGFNFSMNRTRPHTGKQNGRHLPENKIRQRQPQGNGRGNFFSKKYSVRSDSFRIVVEGWIDENEDAISEIERKLSNVKDWRDEAYKRLNG